MAVATFFLSDSLLSATAVAAARQVSVAVFGTSICSDLASLAMWQDKWISDLLASLPCLEKGAQFRCLQV